MVVDWPAAAAGPHPYYLAYPAATTTKARGLAVSRSRWYIDQYFQRAKADRGLDHFEARSWTEVHHHTVLSALAYLFIITVPARAKKILVCRGG